MAEPKVVYSPRPDATPESERSKLMAVYRYLIFECQASEKGASPGAPDDAQRLNNDRTDTEIIPK
jgi:hypothetical protein